MATIFAVATGGAARAAEAPPSKPSGGAVDVR